MSSAANQATSGMSRISTAANATATSATKVGNATRKAAEAAERSGSAAEKAAQKWKKLGEQYGTTSKKATMMMSNLDHASGAIQKTGAVGLAMGGGIAYGMANAVKTVSQFDDSMSSVMAKTGATGESFEALRNKALELGRTTVFTSSQSADAMDKLAMAGWSTDKILAGTGDMLNLASAGAMDLATAADIASDIMTAFQMKADESARAANVLAKAATSTNTSVQQLGYTMKYTGPIAQTFGMSLEETTAIGAKMADSGIKGEMAGTAMRAGLTRLAAPPKPAAGMLAKLKIDTNINGQMRPIFDILSDIEAKFKTMTQAERIDAAKDLFGQEAMSGWLSVLTTGTGTLKEFNEQLINSGGASAEMARIMNDNIGGAFRELNSAVEGAVISIGDQLKEPIRKVAEFLTALIGKFNSLGPTTKKIIAFITVMASALLLLTGPLLILLALIPSAVLGLNSIAGLFGITGAALSGAVAPFLLIVGAITAIIIAFSLLYSKSETFRNFVNGLFSSISKTISAAIKQITDLAKGLWGYILVWWQKDGEKIQNAVNRIIEPLKKMWDSISNTAKPAFEELKSVVFYVWSAIEDNFYSGLDIILGAISVFADIINGDFSGAWNTLRGTVDKVINRFMSAQWITDLTNKFSSLKGGLNDVGSFFNQVFSRIVGYFQSIWPLIKKLFDNIRALVAFFLPAITGYFSIQWEIIKNVVIVAATAILSVIKIAFFTSWEIVKTVMQYIWNVINIVFIVIAGIVKAGLQVLTGDFSGAWETIKQMSASVFEQVKKTIADFISGAIGIGKTFLSGIADGFMSNVDTVLAAAKSVWERIKSVFTGEPITVSPNVQYQGPPVGPPARPYANGGLIDRPHLGLVGEAGPEMIVPLSASRRGRGLELWQQAGQILGAIPYANGGLVGARNVPERQKPSKPPSGMRGAGGKGNGGRGAGPIQITNHISITGDQVAAMSKDEAYMEKTARKVLEELLEKVMEAFDNHTIDNLGTMME
ncbi:phage tail tape measure protein [Aneurinibacillus aneurinilyticus]|uniref:phage tail tape measure protein n=1 Tax=Aneurinibacillus aneurinilyticus TaxID=1391 RepID=UPI003524F571